VTVNHDYYSGVDGSCTFFNVKRIGRGHYVTHADCHRGSYMKAEFKVVGKTMHFKELAYHWSLNGFSANADPAVPSTCGFTAYDIPDGFLSLRAGPGTQYIVKATLPPGYDLKIEESIDGWMHVTVPHLHVNDGYDGYDMLGWVKGKFVKSIECPDIPPDQEPKQDIPPDREPLPVVTPPCALPTIGNPEGKC
jgi:hypothetical protein